MSMRVTHHAARGKSRRWYRGAQRHGAPGDRWRLV